MIRAQHAQSQSHFHENIFDLSLRLKRLSLILDPKGNTSAGNLLGEMGNGKSVTC